MFSFKITKLFTSIPRIANRNTRNLSASNASNEYSNFETITATKIEERVLRVELNRPKQRNAISVKMFQEIHDCFLQLDKDRHIRAVILSGKDKMFTSGIDLISFQEKLVNIQSNEVSRRALELRDLIAFLQTTTQAVAKCRKPVISAVHGGCIGAGIDIISATDIRYCTQDAWFQIKEVDLGLAADLGTLQYFPLVVGNDSITRELVYSSRKMDSQEAKQIGFVGKVLPDYESMQNAAVEMAKAIAAKSPIAVQGSKVCLNQMREDQVNDGLRFIQTWNMSALQSEDLMKAAMAVVTKSETPEFDDL